MEFHRDSEAKILIRKSFGSVEKLYQALHYIDDF